MAPTIYFVLSFVVTFSVFADFCSCIRVDNFNRSLAGFQSALATWYGPPTGVATGGACGYDADVGRPPYSGFISAGSPALFQNSKGCGTCYQVKCTNSICSGSPVTVTIADSCAGRCNGPNGAIHFDLSGIAFGALAKTGEADRLRYIGRVNVLYRRVPCNYPGSSIVFRVDKRSNPNSFATVIENVNKDGGLASVEIQPSNSRSWFPMQQVDGAIYKYNIPAGVNAPFSIRLTQIESKRSIVAQNVIPIAWVPGQYYQSNVNF